MNGWVLLGWLRFASLRFAPLRFASLRVEPHGPAVDRLASPWEPTDCLTFVFLVCSKNENIEILPTDPGVGSKRELLSLSMVLKEAPQDANGVGRGSCT